MYVSKYAYNINNAEKTYQLKYQFSSRHLLCIYLQKP